MIKESKEKNSFWDTYIVQSWKSYIVPHKGTILMIVTAVAIAAIGHYIGCQFVGDIKKAIQYPCYILAGILILGVSIYKIIGNKTDDDVATDDDNDIASDDDESWKNLDLNSPDSPSIVFPRTSSFNPTAHRTPTAASVSTTASSPSPITFPVTAVNPMNTTPITPFPTVATAPSPTPSAFPAAPLNPPTTASVTPTIPVTSTIPPAANTLPRIENSDKEQLSPESIRKAIRKANFTLAAQFIDQFHDDFFKPGQQGYILFEELHDAYLEAPFGSDLENEFKKLINMILIKCGEIRLYKTFRGENHPVSRSYQGVICPPDKLSTKKDKPSKKASCSSSCKGSCSNGCRDIPLSPIPRVQRIPPPIDWNLMNLENYEEFIDKARLLGVEPEWSPVLWEQCKEHVRRKLLQNITSGVTGSHDWFASTKSAADQEEAWLKQALKNSLADSVPRPNSHPSSIPATTPSTPAKTPSTSSNSSPSSNSKSKSSSPSLDHVKLPEMSLENYEQIIDDLKAEGRLFPKWKAHKWKSFKAYALICLQQGRQPKLQPES